MKHHQPKIKVALHELAASLLLEAQWDAQGCYWITLDKQPGGAPYAQVNEELYNGSTGIAFFFSELYTYTQDVQHLAAAEAAARWLCHHVAEQPPRFYTFYTGCSGLIYLLLKLYEHTGSSDWLTRALALQERIKASLRDKVLVDDLLDGYAGLLLVFTYLYAYTKNEESFAMVQACVAHIASSAHNSRRGLKWGYIPNSFDSLCGMSHGAAGIGFALLEAGHYFDHAGLRWLAAQAFAYEQQYYDAALGNWLDLRVLEAQLDNPAVLAQSGQGFLLSRGDAVAWAHGAAGIGFSRLRAWQLTGAKGYRRQALQAAARVAAAFPIPADETDFTLSTGAGGRTWFLLEAAAILKQPSLQSIAETALLHILEWRAVHGFYPSVWGALPDAALMMGSAGIGLLLLRYLHPKLGSSLLAPVLPAGRKPLHCLPGTMTAMGMQTLGRAFPLTLDWLQKAAVPTEPLLAAAMSARGGAAALGRVLGRSLQDLPTDLRYPARALLHIERCALRLCLSPQTVLYSEVARRQRERRLVQWLQAGDGQFDEWRFRICAHVSFIYARYHAERGKRGRWPLLLCAGIGFLVQRHWLDDFSSLVLEGVREQRTAADMALVLLEMAGADAGQLAMIGQRVREQLKVFLEHGFIEVI
jgi:hypothetical protein